MNYIKILFLKLEITKLLYTYKLIKSFIFVQNKTFN